MKLKEVRQTDWFNEMEQRYFKSKNTACPFCGNKLTRKYEGLICNNSGCLLGRFKCGKGWVFIDKKIVNCSLPLNMILIQNLILIKRNGYK